jgi:hypothetical protein
MAQVATTVKARLALQVEEGGRKQVSRQNKNTDVVRVRVKEGTLEPLGPDMDIDSDCSYCGEPHPSSPSATLIQLQTTLGSILASQKGRGRKTRESWKLISALVEYCARHKAEATYELLPAGTKWPAHINFLTLGQRIEALEPELRAVWIKPFDNYFYKAVMLQIGEVGADKAFDRLGDLRGGEIASVG